MSDCSCPLWLMISVSKNGRQVLLLSIMKFILGWSVFKNVWNFSSSCSVLVNIKKQPSSYFLKLLSKYVRKSESNSISDWMYIVSSRYAKTNVAYIGANLVPMAVPFVCRKYVSLKQNPLFSKINFIPSKIKSFLILFGICLDTYSARMKLLFNQVRREYLNKDFQRRTKLVYFLFYFVW